MELAKSRPVSPRLLALAVVVVAIVAFAPATFGEFIYDDKPLILHNGYIHSLANWKRWFTTDFWDVGEEVKRFSDRLVYYRPAITVSYALDWKLGGGEPFAFHVTNLVWHAAASLLAFLALRRWLDAALPAFAAAVLFAVHPTKAESVAWIAGRTDIFCTVGILLAMEGMARRIRGVKWGLWLEIGGTLLAYLTKEQAIVLPVFAAIEIWVLAGRPPIDLAATKKMVRGGAAQLVLALAYVAIRTRVLPVRRNLTGGLRLGDYFGEIAETFGRFFELTFFPHDLSVQQALIQMRDRHVVLSARYVVLGALLVVGLIVAAITVRKKAPVVTLGIALFFVTVLPTSNVLPTGMVTMISERFLYLPLLGLCLALGWALTLVAEHARRVRLAYAAVFVAALLMLVVAARRSDDYVDQHRFWARELALHDDSLEAWRFAIGDASDRRRYGDALRSLARAQTLAATLYPHTGNEADFIVQAAEVLGLLVPDVSQKELARLEQFYGELLLDQAGTAALDLGGAQIRLSRGPVVLHRLQSLRPLILTGRAVLASRLGDDSSAVAMGRSVKAECPLCSHQMYLIAMVQARSGDYAAAFETLDGLAAAQGEAAVKEQRAIIAKSELFAKQAAAAPPGPIQLYLRAQELSNLDAWGRAYAVLKDHKEQIKKAPGFAIGFAELAFRAGDTAVAKEVLASVMPEEKIDPTLKEWAKKMGWS